jgi:hypothetical protein
MRRTELQGAGAFIPETKTFPVLRDAVQECRGCDLYQKNRRKLALIHLILVDRHGLSSGAVAERICPMPHLETASS